MSLNQSEDILNAESCNPNIVLKSAYPDIKSVARLFFVVFFYMIVFGIAIACLVVFFDTYFGKSQLLKSLLNFVMYTITMVVVIKYTVKKSKRLEGSSFGISFNKSPVWLFPVIIISTLALVVFLERIGSLLPMPASVQKFFEKAFTRDIFSMITLTIAAPILEEILCRGIVLRGLLKNYPPYKAILISAIFFAVIHMNPWQALPALFGGLFLGWIYYKTQSVIPGMIVHATINGTAFVFLFLQKNQQSFSDLLPTPYYIALCVISGLVFSGCCVFIQKRIKPTTVIDLVEP